MTERKIVDGRALLQMRLEPIPSDAAGFRTWKNRFIVQLGKLDISGEGTLHEWISAAFNAGPDPDLLDELEQSGQPPTNPSPAVPKVSLLRQRRRKPRLLGFLHQSFRQRRRPRQNRRLNRFQMRKRPRFLASFIVCPTVACMGTIASTVMKTRRVVAFPRVSRKEKSLLPKAKADRLPRLWSP